MSTASKDTSTDTDAAALDPRADRNESGGDVAVASGGVTVEGPRSCGNGDLCGLTDDLVQVEDGVADATRHDTHASNQHNVSSADDATPILQAQNVVLIEATPVAEVLATEIVTVLEDTTSYDSQADYIRNQYRHPHPHDNRIQSVGCGATGERIETVVGESHTDEASYESSSRNEKTRGSPTSHAECVDTSNGSTLLAVDPARPSGYSADLDNDTDRPIVDVRGDAVPHVAEHGSRGTFPNSTTTNEPISVPADRRSIRLSMLHQHQLHEVNFDEEQSHGDDDGNNGNEIGKAASKVDSGNGNATYGGSCASCDRQGFFYHFLTIILVGIGYTLLIFIIFGAVLDRQHHDYPSDSDPFDTTQDDVASYPLQACWHKYERLHIHMEQLRGKALIGCATSTIVVSVNLYIFIQRFLDAESSSSTESFKSHDTRLSYRLLLLALLEVAWFFTNATTLICIDMFTTSPGDNMARACKEDHVQRLQHQMNSEGSIDLNDDADTYLAAIADTVDSHTIDLSAFQLATIMTLPLVAFMTIFHIKTVYAIYSTAGSSDECNGQEDSAAPGIGRRRLCFANTVVPIISVTASVLQYISMYAYLAEEVEKLEEFKQEIEF